MSRLETEAAESQAEDLVAAALLSMGIENASELTPAALGVLERFADRCGLSSTATAEKSERAMEAYFQAHPIPSSLRAEFLRHYREAGAEGEGDRSALEKAAQKLGTTESLARTKAAPNTEAPRGAMAYFAAQQTDKPSGERSSGGKRDRKKRGLI